MKVSNLIKAAVLASPIVLTACGGDDDDNNTDTGPQLESRRYEITIVNTTNNQPVAPAAVILHGDDYYGWQIGSPASEGLEQLAESGSPAMLVSEATNALGTATGDGVLPPGNSTTIVVEAMDEAAAFDMLQLTVAAMPVNTNDAFGGKTGWPIYGLNVGDSEKALLPVYDAGTESNSETSNTVPGLGGEPFNSDRDDIANQVTMHPGVVTSANGYTESGLNASHLFDQGVMLVTVTRVE